jgi:hypothetical protein
MHDRTRTRAGLVTSLVLISTVYSQYAEATPYQPIPPLTPVFRTYNSSITDNFYTINASQSLDSIRLGYTAQGMPFYLERFPQPTTSPFLRYWKGAPQLDHVYLTNNYPDELSLVLSQGYTPEGNEGYIHTQQVPGSVALYRMSKFNGNTNDLVHYYATSSLEAQDLMAQGWNYDHIAGYVHRTLPASGIPGDGLDGFPVIPGGHYMSRRCGPNTACQSGLAFRNYYTGYLSMMSTPKPAGTRQQVMTFDLLSPDYFSTTQREHIAIGLHGQFRLDFSNIERSGPHNALGIIIGESDCGQGATSVRVEAFAPSFSTVTGRCTPNALKNNVTYSFRITVSDTGDVSYTVRDKRTNVVVSSDSLNATGLWANQKEGFPTDKTGYFIVPATLGSADYTLYFTNLRVFWQS